MNINREIYIKKSHIEDLKSTLTNKKSEINISRKKKKSYLKWATIPSISFLLVTIVGLIYSSLTLGSATSLATIFSSNNFSLEILKMVMPFPFSMCAIFTSIFGFKYFKEKNVTKKLESEKSFLEAELNRNDFELKNLQYLNNTEVVKDVTIDLTQERMYEYYLRGKERIIELYKRGKLSELKEEGFGNSELFYLEEILVNELNLESPLNRVRTK